MKLMMIAPGSFPPEEMQSRESYAKSVCSPGTNLRLVSAELPAGASPAMFCLMVPGILQRVAQAEKEGYDAIVIDCFTDVGVEAAKSVTTLPVVGPCEASLRVAYLLADRFGWITPSTLGVPACWRLARGYGAADRIAAIKGVDLPAPEYRQRKDELQARLVHLGREAVVEGAQLILLGCTAMLPAIGAGSAAALSKGMGVTMIDPVGVALRVAEMLVGLHLSQSKAAFPKR